MLDMDTMARYWPLAFGVGGIAVAALLWRMRGEFATKADLAPMRADLTAATQRIERMEGDMRHLPTREDINNLRLAVSNMHGDMREMRAEAKATRDIVERTEAAITRHDDILATAASRGRE